MPGSVFLDVTAGPRCKKLIMRLRRVPKNGLADEASNAMERFTKVYTTSILYTAAYLKDA